MCPAFYAMLSKILRNLEERLAHPDPGMQHRMSCSKQALPGIDHTIQDL